METLEIPRGLCQCGCGERTNIAPKTSEEHGWIKGEPLRFINHHSPKGKHNWNWNGGKSVNHGRPIILTRGHPKTRKNPKTGKGYNYISEHILIAENALGKFLPLGVVVHHYTPEQLVICQDQAYHMLLHRCQRAYEACGHANWRKCWICKQWDDPVKLNISRKDTYHKDCLNLHRQRRKQIEGSIIKNY